MYLEDRIKEIEHALGPLMKVMRLKLTQDTWFLNDCLRFEREGEGNWVSPVEIIFPDQYTSGREQASWDDVRFLVVDVDVFPIGANGWTGYSTTGRRQIEPSGSKDEIIKEFAMLLRKHRLYPTAELPAVANWRLTAAWPQLKEEFDYQGVTAFDIERDGNGYESCYFEADGMPAELRFASSDAILLVNGKEVGRHDADDPSEIVSMVNWQFNLPETENPYKAS